VLKVVIEDLQADVIRPESKLKPHKLVTRRLTPAQIDTFHTTAQAVCVGGGGVGRVLRDTDMLWKMELPLGGKLLRKKPQF